jgi:hypothetical protein
MRSFLPLRIDIFYGFCTAAGVLVCGRYVQGLTLEPDELVNGCTGRGHVPSFRLFEFEISNPNGELSS